MEVLVYTIIGAAITGLAILATKHPAIFDRMSGYLLGLNLLSIICFAVWSFASTATFNALRPFLKADSYEGVTNAMNSLAPSALLVLGAHVAAVAYVLFLSWLGSQIESDRVRNPNSN